MRIRMIMNKEKEENNIKKENQSKQTKNAINSVANIQEQQQSQFRNEGERESEQQHGSVKEP